MQTVLIIIFVLFGAFEADANSTGQGHYVGNSGDGYFVNDQVILRDLYEQGSNQAPYLGNNIDSAIQDSFLKSNVEGILTPTEAEIFQRKLTDLNQLYPHLGEYVLETLKNYDLALIESELGLLPDKTPILNPPGPRVQVANRLNTSIRISHPQWKLMTAPHRIGLLIHEALYALAMPQCQVSQKLLDPICEQSPEKAKEITGAVFRKPASWPHLSKTDFESSFDVKVYSTCDAKQSLSIQIVIDKNSYISDSTFFPSELFTRNELIEKMCLQAQPHQWLKVKMIRPAFKPQFSSFYVKEDSQVWLQKRLALLPQTPGWGFRVQGGGSMCKEKIRREARRWFDEKMAAPQKSYCEHQSDLGSIYVGR